MIEVSQRGRVLHLALNRPDKRNAINGRMCHMLVEAFAQAHHDPSIGAVLLSGNGNGFCAGMDLKEMLEAGGDDPHAAVHDRLFTLIHRASKPIIAAVQGPAIGGGTGLAANAHIVIATPDAKFGLTEIKIGLWPVMIFRAVALAVGERRATELSITGRLFTGAEAFEYGLVSELSDDPLARATVIADQASSFSAHAMAVGLDYNRKVTTISWTEASDLSFRTRAQLAAHPDFKAGVEAFFTRKQ